jgi:stringent starvation protein B
VKPQRPYLLRALYEWILDSDETPYIVVDATCEQVRVPLEYVEDGKIVLNISANAVREFEISNEYLACLSRFSGKEFSIYLPMESVKAIYCKDSGLGMAFDQDFEARLGEQSRVGDDTSAEVELQQVVTEPEVSQEADTPDSPDSPDSGREETGAKQTGAKPTLRLV